MRLAVHHPDDGRDPSNLPIWQDFGCIATLGTGGCGFEQPPESSLAAHSAGSAATSQRKRGEGCPSVPGLEQGPENARNDCRRDDADLQPALPRLGRPQGRDRFRDIEPGGELFEQTPLAGEGLARQLEL